MPYVIAYEDDTLLVIDKRQGLPVTPGKDSSLCDELFSLRPDLAVVRGFKPGEGGLLNRLDNETGGLVLFAKSDQDFLHYAQEMRGERVTKTYLAAVHGRPAGKAGVIDLPLGHSRKSVRRMLIAGKEKAVRGRALPARTAWRLVDSRPSFSLLEVEITKGVRHQIRVHLTAIDCPLVGDRLYNRKGGATLTPFHLLYCFKINFTPPSGAEKEVRVGVPWGTTWSEFESFGN